MIQKEKAELLSQKALTDIDYKELSLLQQAIFDGANYSIISTEIDGTIRSFNNAAAKMLGYKPEEVIGKHTPALFHDPDEVAKRADTLSKELGREVKANFEVFVAKAELGLIEELEWRYVHKNGSHIPVLLSLTPLRDKNNTINGFLGISFDISESQFIKRALKEEEERYRLLFERSSDSILLLKEDTFVDCNPATFQMFGCSREDIIGKSPMLFSPEYQPDGKKSIDEVLKNITNAVQGSTVSIEWQHLKWDKTPFDAEVTLNAIELQGEPHIFATVRDVSSRKIAERELENSRKQLLDQNQSLKLINHLSNQFHGNHSFKVFAEKILDAILGVTGTTHIAIYFIKKEPVSLELMASHGIDKKIVEASTILQLNDSLSGYALEKNEIVFTHDFNKAPRIEEQIKQYLLASNIQTGVSIPLTFQNRPFGCINLGYEEYKHFTDFEIETLQVVSNTISLALANAHQINDLDYMAHHDSLTGLSNRLFFHCAFADRIKKPSYQNAAVLLLDLDRFKEINDTLGHHIGDILLQQIGPRLSSICRDEKITLSRLGGDEFIVLIDDISDKKETRNFAEALLKQLREPFEINSILLEIDASIGIAQYPRDGKDSHALLRSADVAMYEAKNKGGGIKFYYRNDDKHTPERLALIAELNSATRDEQLELHYQPKVDLTTGKINGFEALVRWRHSDMGLLYPNKFILLAEMSDSIHYVTEAVLEIALKQQQKWYDSGYRLPVSVNLSARNLIDNRCVHFIEKMLIKYNIKPGMLELELTETALMQDPETAVALLNQISKLGVKLSVDDFGTGYSSLSYLRRMPINQLKIDREFVKDMLLNYQDSIIVSSTISLAHNLNLKVVAEGVEDKKTMERLKQLGCDFAQGYYICKPKVWSEIETWLKTNPLFIA